MYNGNDRSIALADASPKRLETLLSVDGNEYDRN